MKIKRDLYCHEFYPLQAAGGIGAFKVGEEQPP